MKRTRLTPLTIAAATGLLTLAPAWCSEDTDAVQIPAAPSNLSLTLVASNTPVEEINPFMHTTAARREIASAQWTDIKDNPFERRDLFAVGLRRLQAKVDLQITELDAKRASMVVDDTETKSWDFAMKEMQNARSYLLSMSSEADTATRENWDQVKSKVEFAWLRTQDAYGKVKASTTA